ncbi:MAG: Hsp20/alpha crystallin family protein [Proteobacteria bacterium]|nr:Hsp20/alpha crystallin family protein [Pseudomonadota bacterium]
MYLTRWSNFDREFGRSFAALDELRRRMNDVFRGFDQPAANLRSGYAGAVWPRTNLYDSGSELVLYAAVPGLSDKDINISATGDVLAVSGERGVEAREGYSVHRQERPHMKFSRSFALPCRVDLEKASATVKDGILTIRLPKAAEAQPRQITVKASS